MPEKSIQIVENQQINPCQWEGWKNPFHESILQFHQQLPEYAVTPFHDLKGLPERLGVNRIWVKDESYRCGLKAYKALGGSYAIAKYLQQRYKLDELNFEELHVSNFPDSEGITFATMTDGNHGLGVAYIASKLGFNSQIYVPKEMVPARIEAIKRAGGTVTVFEGGYDDAARQIAKDAEKYGWQVISDTAWEGYTQIPEWIIEGYSTIFEEVREQLKDENPTHIFIQAGVGSLASSLIQYFRTMYRQHEISIIITESNRADCFYHSVKINDGNAHSYTGKVDTMMAGLACAEPNPIAWPFIRDGVNFMLSCTDGISALGMQRYYDPHDGDPQIVSGEAGAVTLGVVHEICSKSKYQDLKEKLALNQDSRILLVNTEGATDPINFEKVVKG